MTAVRLNKNSKATGQEIKTMADSADKTAELGDNTLCLSLQVTPFTLHMHLFHHWYKKFDLIAALTLLISNGMVL